MFADIPSGLTKEQYRNLDRPMSPAYPPSDRYPDLRNFKDPPENLETTGKSRDSKITFDEETGIYDDDVTRKMSPDDPRLKYRREQLAAIFKRQKSKHKNKYGKSHGGGGGGDPSPPSSDNDRSESPDDDSSDSGDSKNNNESNLYPSSYDSDEVSSSSSGSKWSNDGNDSAIFSSGSSGESTSSSDTRSSLTGRRITKGKGQRKPKLSPHRHQRRSRRLKNLFDVRKYLSVKMRAKMTQDIMKYLSYLPDGIGQRPFVPTGDLDRDSEAFFDFMQLLHDAFVRWPPLLTILADAHRDGSIHAVRREFDEAAYAATHRLFPKGVTDSFLGKHKSVVEALRLMRKKYANGGRDAIMSRKLQLMKTNMLRGETASDFIERVTRIQRQGLAQNAPIKNRELRNHVMHVLKHSRMYRVEAAALEGTAYASRKKLTLKTIKDHFNRLDKRRRQRAKVFELSGPTENDWNVQRNRPNRRAQAYAANARRPNPTRGPTPIMNNVAVNRDVENRWQGKERVAVMRPPPRPNTANNMNMMGNMAQAGQPFRNMANVTCYYCREKGHISSNCPKKVDKGFKGFRDGDRANAAFHNQNPRNPRKPGQKGPGMPDGKKKKPTGETQ